MKGNFHVQFLGGWGAAMLPGYPARLDSLVTKGLAAYLIARGKGGDSLGDRSQGSHTAGSARVAILALPPPGGTTLVPVPRAGARAQGLLHGLSVRETLVRGLGQTS